MRDFSPRKNSHKTALTLTGSCSDTKFKMPYLLLRPLPTFLFIVFVSIAPCSTGGQPFLNSLAVLFRARPPWPTTFPSAKFPPIPSPLVSSSGNQHGILVAHPLSPSANNFDPMNKNANGGQSAGPGNGNGGGDDSKSKKPDMIDSGSGHQSHPPPPVPSPQQNFVPIPSVPTLSSLLPLYPPPMSMFQNNHVLGAGHSRIPHPGGNNNHHHHHNHHHNHHNKGNHNHHHPNQGPPLVSSPTSIVGSYSFPETPSTVPNPNYAVLLENNYPNKGNNDHKKHKPGFRGNNAWNPLLAPANHNHGNNVNGGNNNHNIHLHGNQNQNPNGPPHHQSAISSEHHINVGYNNNGTRSERQRKQKKLLDFRPSPQLNSYLETTVISDYASHVQANNGHDLRNNPVYGQKENVNGQGGNSKEQNPDKAASTFNANEATTYPRFETGFRPISGDQYAAGFGTTSTRPHYTNSKQQYFNPWSIPFDPNNGGGQNNNSYPINGHGHNANSIHAEGDQHGNSYSRGEKPFRQDRQILAGAVPHAADVNTDDGSSSEEDDPLVFFGNRGRKKSSEQEKGKSRHRFSSKGKKLHGVSATLSSTTASSELVEEWLPPGVQIEKKSDSTRKFPIFSKKRPAVQPASSGPRGMAKLPDKCNKFHRFGFCPVTRQYPLDAAEAIASRCSALLSHLIAPLPKIDVQYDIGAAEGKNRTTGKGRSSGWSWRSYQGKPVCDTDEITTVPGWAKNENGEWMIILQTKIWQQKAHISLCSPSATHCQGLACSGQTNGNDSGGGPPSPSNEKTSNAGGSEIRYTKCVQRFTAQRLAVFDPENPDRCPVVRSVFLPSACVCLSSTGNPNGTGPNLNSVEKDQSSQTTFPGRQPLFSTNEEGVHYADDKGINPYPVESVETLMTAKPMGRSMGRTKVSTSSSSSTRESSSQGESRSTQAKNSHQPSSVVSSQTLPTANATFMIITEKFTTNERSGSKEATELMPGSTEIVNGTHHTSQVSN